MRFEHSVVIDSEPEVVFGWIGDPQRAREWQPDIAAAEVLHEEPDVVGTEFREVLEEGRGRIEMHGRIIEFEPGRSMAVQLEGHGVRVTARYEVSAHPAGALVQAQQSLALPGGVARLLEPLVRRRVSARAHADLQRLKDLCERASPPGGPVTPGRV